MFKKILNEIKKIVKENYIFLIIFFLILMFMNVKLPYYVETTGGVINLEDRVVGDYKTKGTLNMAYVSSLDGYIPNIIYAWFNKEADIISKETETGTSTEKEAEFRNNIALKDSIDSATIIAYKAANKDVEILNKKVTVAYIFEEADTTLKIGDIITKIDNKNVDSKEDIKNIVTNLDENSYINIEVINKNKTYTRQAKIINYEGKNILGIMCYVDYDLKLNPDINIKFENNESGPSGGLMLALSIYSKISKKDITNGLNIAGTGTIDEYGNVGEISGVKYKLKGAVDSNMDVFLVAKENYKEAIKEKKKNNYDIEIYSVSNFEEALDILKKVR